MAKKENYAKVLDDFHKHMKECEGMMFDESPEFEEWLNALERDLREVSAKAVKNVPESMQKKGFAEAYFIGLARFTCRILNQMERQGMFAEGKDGFGFYTKVLLPVCNELVVSEMDDAEQSNSEADEIVQEIIDLSIPIDDILKKHFDGREDEWPDIRKSLEEGRQIAKERGAYKG